MPRTARNFEGFRKGRLIVTHRVGVRTYESGAKHPLWSATCDCGNVIEATACQLTGKTTSCGCLKAENNRRRLTTHGMAAKGDNRSRVYRIWNAMKQRCQNPNQPHYERYGGRGIKVCDRWQEFAYFYADMGDPPSENHSIDRIDNYRGYDPGNCRWATTLEQAQNKR